MKSLLGFSSSSQVSLEVDEGIYTCRKCRLGDSVHDRVIGPDAACDFVVDEWRKFEAWRAARPRSQRSLKQSFRNWLAKTTERKESSVEKHLLEHRAARHDGVDQALERLLAHFVGGARASVGGASAK